jgi:two-component system invasion response regulator UvrY
MAERGKARAVITVLVVDDHPVVRAGVREILANTIDVRIGGMAQDAEAALQAVAAGAWSVVILDLSLPGRGGLELLRELRERYPRLPVLILSMHAERDLVVHSLRAGAAGYVTKDSASEELVTAIRRVASGGKYVSASLSETLVGELQPGGRRPPHEALSEREFEVFRLIAEGKGGREIARRLKLGETTVSTYRSRILTKMGFAGNSEIIRYAIQNGLVD